MSEDRPGLQGHRTDLGMGEIVCDDLLSKSLSV
jgi:hypothetical protein